MSLTLDRLRRIGGLAGLLFIVLAILALVVPGSPPKADEVAKIPTFFSDKRDEILLGDYLLGLAVMFFLLFVGSLRAQLGARDRGDGLRPGPGLLAAGGAAAALLIAGAAVLSGAVLDVAAAGDQNLNHALYDVSSGLFAASGFAFAAFFVVAAFAIASTDLYPSVLAPFSLLAALLNALGPLAMSAKSGFFATGEAFGFIVPIVSLLWVLAVSLLMLRGRAPDRAGAATA
jgi:hypothetical protein